MEHLTGTRIRREATPATVNLRRCKLVVIKGSQRGTEFRQLPFVRVLCHSRSPRETCV